MLVVLMVYVVPFEGVHVPKLLASATILRHALLRFQFRHRRFEHTFSIEEFKPGLEVTTVTMISQGIQGSLGAPELKVMTAESKGRAVVSPQNVPSPEMQNSMVLSDGADSEQEAVSRGGVVTPFPWKLHDMLESVEEEGYAHIVSWQPHGRCFAVHKPIEFVQLIKKYFNQSKLASFQRQLNLCKFML